MSPTEVAKRFIAAIESGDVEAVRSSVYDPDVKIWHCSDRKWQNLEENIAGIKWLSGATKSVLFANPRIRELDNGFVLQHVMTLEAKNGAKAEVDIALVCSLNEAGDRILVGEEYFDAALFTKWAADAMKV
ncbi:hypothetical protein DFJ74DRAFT_671445 [Hyaloraphidium curvatum]|nr:hypothetical protein DFJ74DRAFT_671445 [Hyaloraphidium curvatum]